MTKVKYKDLKQEEKAFVDYTSMFWVRIMTFSAFLGLGVWMLISPEKPEHRSIEKSTVYLLKEIWGLPLGIIFTIIGVVGIAFFINKMLKYNNYAFIRVDKNGFYLFHKKRRISGLASIYDGNDLVVFHKETGHVARLKNYLQQPIQQYLKAFSEENLTMEGTYWSANQHGYNLIVKGESVLDSTSEYRGDDLVVSAPKLPYKLLFANYKNAKDDKVREARYL